MSFPRHEEIYPSDGGSTLVSRTPAHRLDEFPAGYSLAGCSPAEPASALPASFSLSGPIQRDKCFASNGDLSLICLSQAWGPLHSFPDFWWSGGQGRNRTADAGLFRAALYQLSYLAVVNSYISSIGLPFLP
jgi:hypothetical protein